MTHREEILQKIQENPTLRKQKKNMITLKTNPKKKKITCK
jgi:hypothetical protein